MDNVKKKKMQIKRFNKTEPEICKLIYKLIKKALKMIYS